MDYISDFTSDLNNISGLSDSPNITDGLSASALKAKFDLAGNTIKGFIRTTLITAINALIDLSHSHSNKTLLDTYAQTEANLSTAVTDAHTHANKTLLDTYTQTETNLASAVSSKHTHGNKSVLDGIVSAPAILSNSQTFTGTQTFAGDLRMSNSSIFLCDCNYGNQLPSAGYPDRIFFKKV